jgi:hypothetical protein
LSRKIAVFAAIAVIAAWAPSAASASNPSAVGTAAPSSVQPGGATVLAVAVTPGGDPASTGIVVTCNLTSIGGSFSQLLADDGTAGDATAGDLVFSYRASVSSTTSPGSKSLPCVVSDDQGRIALPTISLEIGGVVTENASPTVDGGGPYTVDEGGTLGVGAAGSDPEGGAVSYAWDLDHDGVYETAGQTATMTAGDGPATATIGVRITDDGGLTGTDVATVTIRNVAPTASFAAPASAEVGKRFAISLTGLVDPSAADTAAGFTYAFDCGSGYGAFTAVPAAECTAAAAGSLAVGAKIRDKDGGASEYRATVAASVTADGLCALTRSLTDKQQVADALCGKLAHGSYDAYLNQLAAQSGDEPGKAYAVAVGARLAALAAAL